MEFRCVFLSTFTPLIRQHTIAFSKAPSTSNGDGMSGVPVITCETGLGVLKPFEGFAPKLPKFKGATGFEEEDGAGASMGRFDCVKTLLMRSLSLAFLPLVGLLIFFLFFQTEKKTKQKRWQKKIRMLCSCQCQCQVELPIFYTGF